MSTESTSAQLIKRLGLTRHEVSVANRAAKLIRRYRIESRGAWSGPTANDLVSQEVGDPSRQLSVLTLACTVEKETRSVSPGPQRTAG